MAEIINIDSLLKIEELFIPSYQRPYKWDNRNIEELLIDISVAITEFEHFGKEYRYRIGTIILHDSGRKKEIVDGQQRIISLLLIALALNPKYKSVLLETEFKSKISQKNINDNYRFILEWFSLKETSVKNQFFNAFEQILEVVVIYVKKQDEAFQLFDSQNTRGKALDPHDLLKAYHLREMKNDIYEMEHAVELWESKNTIDIRNLFDLFLYPAINWSKCEKTKTFTAKEIDIFKGIKIDSSYTYAKRTFKAMPYFQITEPLIAGNSFFEMVEHYLSMLNDIKKEIANNPLFSKLEEILEQKTDSAGFKYSKNLFLCALLVYYDRFHNFDEMAIKKLFTWAFMIRVDMENLGFDTINKYSIGEFNIAYSNNIAMFSKIQNARRHTDIANIKIVYSRWNDSARISKWNDLYTKLKELNGIKSEK